MKRLLAFAVSLVLACPVVRGQWDKNLTVYGTPSADNLATWLDRNTLQDGGAAGGGQVATN
ncbi:MAG: hypothetical protein KJ556_21405, partial [Gammaproteobacteria bacterium]|nr:hypothetical protein [Gammaproteobacteria bacterium]